MSTDPPTLLKILFVDDETKILDGLRRQFRGKRREWSMRFAASGAEALELMDQDPADVVVTDMRMPQMNGTTLLREVRERWSGSVRIVLSGQTDQAELLNDIGVIHQFLQKPCPADQLEQAVARATQTSRALSSPELAGAVSGLESLPVVSEAYRELAALLEDEGSDARAIGKVVQRDVGLSTKLLQMVNSAFFGMPRTIRSVPQAVTLVGVQNLKFMALTAQIFDTLAEGGDCDRVVGELWHASADLGGLAAGLARGHGRPAAVCDAARLAASLSLIGRAVLIRNRTGCFTAVQERAAADGVSLDEAERDLFGLAQQDLGAHALGLWAFDDDTVNAVAHQARPEACAGVGPDHPLPYVHLARAHVARPGVLEPLAPARTWAEALGLDADATEVLSRGDAA